MKNIEKIKKNSSILPKMSRIEQDIRLQRKLKKGYSTCTQGARIQKGLPNLKVWLMTLIKISSENI
jgi:hypothetical protein